MLVFHGVNVCCIQVRSDSIQDLSFVRDADRFSSMNKHLSTTSTQPDAQKEIPPAGLSGLYSLSVSLQYLLNFRDVVWLCCTMWNERKLEKLLASEVNVVTTSLLSRTVWPY